MSAGARPIYMDHNATTPVLPEVVRAMIDSLSEDLGNPSSTTHIYGRKAAELVESARAEVARLIGARRPEEILFTAGATESDNLAIRGVAGACRGKDHIITCAVEHEAVLESCEALRREGAAVTVLPVDRQGQVDPDDVRRAITPRTSLASVMMANNETGTLQPIELIASICRERGVLFHSDAVQAVGRIPVDVEEMGADLVSLTAHKMYGPKGVGALWKRTGVRIDPQMRGGGQERGLRSGTLNVPGIAGLAAAAAAAARDLAREADRQRRLRSMLWDEIRSRVDGVSLNGHPDRTLPGTLSLAFEGVESESLILALRDVAALSSGSACASGTGKGSYVIRAMHPGPDGESRARCTIRFGLGRSNDETQVRRVAARVCEAVGRLRSIAPHARPGERTETRSVEGPGGAARRGDRRAAAGRQGWEAGTNEQGVTQSGRSRR